MKIDPESRLSKEEIEFAQEIIDMLELRMSEGLELVDLANQELKEIEWTYYEEDFDDRIRQYLISRGRD